MLHYMLTTVDNPYNPFDDYNSWLAYDLQMKHNTNAYLARLVVTAPGLSDKDQLEDINSAMRIIVENDVLNLYRIVQKDIIETSNLDSLLTED